MTGDCHVRFCERRGVRLPPATHPKPSRYEPVSARVNNSGDVGLVGTALVLQAACSAARIPI